MQIVRTLLCMFAAVLLNGCIGAGSISPAARLSDPKMFPSLRGIDLEGSEKNIPADLAGETRLLLVAFKHEQQEQVDTWLKGIESVAQSHPNFRFYEVPLIYELSMMGRFWVNNGMRSGIKDSAARRRTITVYTDREIFFSNTGMQAESIYAVLLDKSGREIWRSEGPANGEKLEQLKSALKQSAL